MLKVQVAQLHLHYFLDSSHITCRISSWLSIFSSCSIQFSHIRIPEDRWKSSSVFGIEIGYLPTESSKFLYFVQSLISVVLPFPLRFASDPKKCVLNSKGNGPQPCPQAQDNPELFCY
jgi:hypothetical protein